MSDTFERSAWTSIDDNNRQTDDIPVARGASRLSDRSSDDSQRATDVRRAVLREVPREAPRAEGVEGALGVRDAVRERRCGDHRLWS